MSREHWKIKLKAKLNFSSYNSEMLIILGIVATTKKETVSQKQT